MGAVVDDEFASQFVLDAIAAQPDKSLRAAVALAIYGTTHRKRNFREPSLRPSLRKSAMC